MKAIHDIFVHKNYVLLGQATKVGGTHPNGMPSCVFCVDSTHEIHNLFNPFKDSTHFHIPDFDTFSLDYGKAKIFYLPALYLTVSKTETFKTLFLIREN